MNKFRMRTDVLNYSLGGMGCSAGLISVDVAQRVLQCVAPLPLSCRGLCSYDARRLNMMLSLLKEA